MAITLALCLFLIPIRAQAQDIQLTLDRAKAIALENSPTLASAMERVNQAREEISQARSAYLPTLSAKGGYNYTEAILDTSADETKHTAQLTLTQTLFDGFNRKYATLSAKYGKQANQAALDDARRLLSWSVAQAWVNVQLARENIRIAQSDMAFNQKQQEEAAIKQEAGTGSLSDRLNFETKVISARTNVVNYQQDLLEARIGLAALMGYGTAQLPRGMTIAGLDSGGHGREATLPDLETLADQRPDIRKAGLAVDQAQAAVGVAKSDFYPTLSLTGGYGTSMGSNLLDDDTMGASLGFAVTIDLFDGGNRRSKVRQARSDQRELEKDLKSARITALSELRTALADISTAREQLKLQEKNTNLVEKTRNLVDKEYQAGQVSLVRLNEAQNNLVTARGNLANARTNLVLALEAFDYYSGTNIP
ncbi:MAG: TolC family protein [Desulfobacterales bacterium]|nr:TolC family protein [Desulfobacterales bacterium]